MTQTTVRPDPGRPTLRSVPPPGVVIVPAGPGRVRTVVQSSLAGTPGRLRVLTLVLVAAALLFGLAGAQAARQRAAALDDARASARQVVTLQEVRARLAEADAVVSNAFLVAGPEPVESRQRFVAARDAVAAGLARAAQQEPRDQDALRTVTQQLADYTGLVEAARANNRQGLPVGAAYLKQASVQLDQEQMQTELRALVKADQGRFDDALGAAGTAGTLLLLCGLLALAVLVGGQVWLARRVKRYLNLPVAAGTALVLVALTAGIVTMAAAQGDEDEAQTRTFAAANALAQARTSAFVAKANESFRLINRGNGAGFEKNGAAALAEAEKALADARRAGASTRLSTSLTAWEAVHREIAALDDKNDWEAARDRAVGSGDQDSNVVFTAFSDDAADVLGRNAQATDDGLKAPHLPLLVTGWGILAAGVAAAVAATRGISQRLAEYR